MVKRKMFWRKLLTHSRLVTYMHQWPGSSFVCLIACFLFHTVINWNNANILLIGNFLKHSIHINMPRFSSKKMHLKIVSARCQSFHSGHNMLKDLAQRTSLGKSFVECMIANGSWIIFTLKKKPVYSFQIRCELLNLTKCCLVFFFFFF